MARTRLTSSLSGVAEVRRDLQSVRLGLGRELSQVLRDSADDLAAGTRRHTPRGPGPSKRGRKRSARKGGGRYPARDTLPHIADTIVGRATAYSAQVVSDHPGAIVHEHGGTIAPRGREISIDKAAMAHKAGEADLPRIERDLEQRINALLARHGLT